MALQSRFHSLLAASLTTIALVALTACGDDNTATPSTTTDDRPGAVIAYTGDFASSYCMTARDWVAHDLVAFDAQDPEAFRAYWAEYEAFNQTATSQAPAEIAADWAVFEAAQADLTAMLEKYDFDLQRFDNEATDDEKSFFYDTPPPAQEQAQEHFHRYEAEVCHTSEIGPAEISYTGDANSAYCQLADDNPSLVDESKADLIDFFTNGSMAQLVQDRIAAAPPELKSDVEVEENWLLEWVPKVMAAHDWDFAQVLREGTETELIGITFAAPEVRDSNSRINAYYAQVCGM